MKLSAEMIFAILGTFFLGSATTYVIVRLAVGDKRKISSSQNTQEAKKRHLGTMDWILIAIGIFLVALLPI